MRRFAAIILLICATTHCVFSIFHTNTSYLNLSSYAHGTAPEPFQRRFLMVPVLRAAESSLLPQVFSIAGFLWLPVWLGVKYLTSQECLALYAATAMIFFTFFFATWNETRAWSEWTVLFAILAAVQLERSFSTPPLIQK